MTFEEKVEKAKEIMTLWGLPSTVVMSSFGKDSMVLLDIMKKCGLKLPILFIREPFFQEKYAFADQQIHENDYSVYAYPPLWTGVVQNPAPKTPHDEFEIAGFYQIGSEEEYIFLPTGITRPTVGEPFLCGLYDVLNKPTGTFKFPWTAVMLGHKSSDKDPIMGEVPLEGYVAKAGPVTAVFPIKDFTDDDIWRYHSEFGVPVHKERYANGRELEDKKFNPDYFPACMACLDKNEAGFVFCPKIQKPVRNVSASVKFVTVPKPSYVR